MVNMSASMARSAWRRAEAPRPEPASRDRLLDGAAALIVRHQRLDISLAEIAGHTGLNAALVKYYFGSKAGLLTALARRDAARALREMDQLLRKPIPPTEKMRLHISGIMEAYRRSPYLNRLLHALLTGPDRAAATELREHLVRPVLACQQQILADGIAAGAFRAIDPMVFYLGTIGACDQFMHTAEILALAEPGRSLAAFQDRYINDTTDLLLAGIAARPGDTSP